MSDVDWQWFATGNNEWYCATSWSNQDLSSFLVSKDKDKAEILLGLWSMACHGNMPCSTNVSCVSVDCATPNHNPVSNTHAKHDHMFWFVSELLVHDLLRQSLNHGRLFSWHLAQNSLVVMNFSGFNHGRSTCRRWTSFCPNWTGWESQVDHCDAWPGSLDDGLELSCNKPS